jgi:hypothetical protein
MRKRKSEKKEEGRGRIRKRKKKSIRVFDISHDQSYKIYFAA